MHAGFALRQKSFPEEWNYLVTTHRVAAERLTGLKQGASIDHIFHSKHFRSVDSSRIRRNGSDRFLLVPGLELE
jgi:hypothetical protein